MRALFAFALLLTLSIPAHAGKGDDERLIRLKKIILLKSHLDRLQTGDAQFSPDPNAAEEPNEYHRVGSFLVGFTNELKSQFTLCAWPSEYSDNETDCIQNEFAYIVNAAAEDSVIDPVEETHLLSYQPTLIVKDGKVTVDASLFVPIVDKNPHLKPNEMPLPPFQEYVAEKRTLQKMRVSNHQPPNFTLEFLKTLKKVYRKRINGIGRVDMISYLLSAYNRIELNTLTDQMMDTLNLMTAKSAVTTFETDKGTVSIPMQGHLKSTYAYCTLKLNLKKMSQDPSSLLFRKAPTVEDALISSVLVGKMPVAWASELMKRREFQVPNPTPGKVVKIIGDVGKILLLTQPELIPFSTFGTMIYQTIQRKKEMEHAASEETDLFNCN